MARASGVFVFQAEDGIRDLTVTGVQTCALPIYSRKVYVDAGRVRVPMREISLGGGQPPLRVYDTSGPPNVNVREGLPKLRSEERRVGKECRSWRLRCK